MSKNMRKGSVLKVLTSLLDIYIRYFSATWLKPMGLNIQKKVSLSAPEESLSHNSWATDGANRSSGTKRGLGVRQLPIHGAQFPGKVRISQTPRELWKSMKSWCSVLRENLQLFNHTSFCTIILKIMRKTVFFCTCGVPLSSKGSCFSSLSCTGPLCTWPVSWNTVSSFPAQIAPSLLVEKFLQSVARVPVNREWRTWVVEHGSQCLVRHLPLETRTSQLWSVQTPSVCALQHTHKLQVFPYCPKWDRLPAAQRLF